MSFDWGSLIGAAVSAYGASQGSKASKDAGKEASKAAASTNDHIWRMFQQQQAQQQPFYQAGLTAQNRYMQMLGLGGSQSAASNSSAMPTEWFVDDNGTPAVNQQLYDSDPRYRYAWDRGTKEHWESLGRGYGPGSDRNVMREGLARYYNEAPGQEQAQETQGNVFDLFRNTPGYQFGLDQGNKQVQASAAARGGLNSGATLKALQKFGTDYADQQGFTPYMNRLASLFGGAQTAATNMGNAGQQAASEMGANNRFGANARAQGIYGANQAWQSGMQDAWGYANKAYGSMGWGGV